MRGWTMRAPEFEAMVGPARIYPEIWRILLGLLLILFVYAGVIALLLVALFAMVGPLAFFGEVQALAAPDRPRPTLMLLATFLGLFLGPILAAAACHFRGPGTLFGPRDEFLRGLFIVLAVTVPLYGALTLVGAALEPPVDNLAWLTWLTLLPLAIPLVAMQVTAEELVFRGYLQQQLAARFRARWIWMGLPSAMFAVLHFNPAAGHAVWLILLATFAFAMVAADLTERTGSLGAAVGFHFVNNVFGLLVISIPGTITGLARWTAPYGLEATGQIAVSLVFNIVFLVVVWRILRWALDR
jgi:uncharacterized protein